MVNYPTGGEWALLYSSAANGFSLNRFLHHCSDYHGPSVTLFTCRDGDGTESLSALAVDVEWRFVSPGVINSIILRKYSLLLFSQGLILE